MASNGSSPCLLVVTGDICRITMVKPGYGWSNVVHPGKKSVIWWLVAGQFMVNQWLMLDHGDKQQSPIATSQWIDGKMCQETMGYYCEL